MNTLSQQVRKTLKEKVRAFFWKGAATGKVKWEVLLQDEEEGGVGLRDPLCALDAAKVRMLVSLMTKDRQPWMKWVERKLRKVAKKWGVQEAMAARPTKKQLMELKADCIVESTLKVWLEIGGQGGGKREEERKTKEGKVRVALSGLGLVEAKEGWTPIERMKSREAYNRLVQRRMKLTGYTPKAAHRTIKTIQRKLTAKERDYWWRLTHRVVSIKKRESKWRRDDEGKLVSSKCPVCKNVEETWEHYDFECEGVKEMNERAAASVGRAQAFSKAAWRLEEEGMEEREKLMIAKARWVYHCERCKMDMGKQRRLNINKLMDRVNRRIEIAEGAQ